MSNLKRSLALVSAFLLGGMLTASSVAPGEYSVQYRVIQSGDSDWQAWQIDGGTAGVAGKNIEQIQVELIPKVEPTPTSTPTVTATPTPTPTPTPQPTNGRFAFSADIGLDAKAAATLKKIGENDYDVVVFGGDLGYEPNAAVPFCNLVKANINEPISLVPGNHEEDGSPDGPYSEYLACLPDSQNSTALNAGRDYYFDKNGVRFVNVSPDVVFPNMTTYATGTPEREWLKTAVRDAKAQGKWTIISMHHPCFSVGLHGCSDTTNAVSELAISLGVDIVFTGHDHLYARSHQIRGTTTSPVVIDTDNNYAQQTEAGPGGTVFVVAGHAGHNPRDSKKPIGGIWKSIGATNMPGGFSYGYSQFVTEGNVLRYQVRLHSGPNLGNDAFTITR